MNQLDFVENKIVKNWESISQRINLWNFKGEQIVFTNGCFDIVHRGHIDYLSKAKDKGDRLIIGLNTDKSVKALKGETRPINDEDSRALLLASFSFVDAVILFNEDTPYELINFLKPNILVKGSDYDVKDIVGSDIVINNGGRVETLDFIEGFSSTSIINKIKNS
ncbi:MAG: D-glycero-beta-D-manno-heptose 1-phosphate adenylyltransferase [Marinifilaceae bacterium]|jgi:rfaE bifunctional protein nucleotidyltransferase chain/domain|nr:D-glycero-beta-D-manno-heptose 1-phosphate adenylyltransferase [Marinifilaceae bacterium]